MRIGVSNPPFLIMKIYIYINKNPWEVRDRQTQYREEATT
jgi:hypothetical protein